MGSEMCIRDIANLDDETYFATQPNLKFDGELPIGTSLLKDLSNKCGVYFVKITHEVEFSDVSRVSTVEVLNAY